MLTIRHLAPGGAVSAVGVDELGARLEGSGTLWVDLSAPSEEEFARAAAVFDWHPLAIEDCLHENHLPKADDYGDHILLVLHAFDIDPATAAFDSKELEVFLGPNYIVTHHAEPTALTEDLARRCEQNPALAGRGPAYLLYLLLDSMTDVYLPYLDTMDDRIERVESDLVGGPRRETLRAIYELRRDVIAMRRIVTPQIEVMRRMGRAEFSVVPDEAAVYFRDIYDDLFRITQAADSYRELLAGALDSYLTALSNEMNEVMKVLTVFASIMLPLTFLAGIWGMNFEHMPELGWVMGYPFALGLMALTAAGLLWAFRRRRWL